MENKSLQKQADSTIKALDDADLLREASNTISDLVSEIEDLERVIDDRNKEIRELEDKLNNTEK